MLKTKLTDLVSSIASKTNDLRSWASSEFSSVYTTINSVVEAIPTDNSELDNGAGYAKDNEVLHTNSTTESKSGNLNLGSDFSVEGVSNQSGIYSADGSVKRVLHPKGGAGWINDHTGFIQVKAPTGTTNTHIIIEMSVYQYTSTTPSLILQISAYLGSNGDWGYCTPIIIGGSLDSDVTVRFGNDGTNHCIWLGDSDTIWDNAFATVDRLMSNGDIDKLHSGWDVGKVTETSTVKWTKTSNLPFGDYLKLKNTPNLDDYLTLDNLPTSDNYSHWRILTNSENSKNVTSDDYLNFIQQGNIEISRSAHGIYFNVPDFSWSNITGKPNLDNYQSWNLKTNGIQRTTVKSGETADFVNGNNVNITYSAGGQVVINSVDTTYANMSLSELTSGSSSNARSVSAKTLNDWISEKNFLRSSDFDPTTKADKNIQIITGRGLGGGGNLGYDRTIYIESDIIDDIAKGVTAHGYGNHASQGYLKSDNLPEYDNYQKWSIGVGDDTFADVITGDNIELVAGDGVEIVREGHKIFFTITGGGYDPNLPPIPEEPSSYESETTAFMNAIGIPKDDTYYFSGTEQHLAGITWWVYINQLVLDLKSALGVSNLSTKLNAVYPRFGIQVSRLKYNLLNPQDTDAAFRGTYYGDWTHTASGSKGNGVNAYVGTHIIPEDVQNSDGNGMIVVFADDIQGYSGVGTISGGRSCLIFNATTSTQFSMNGYSITENHVANEDGTKGIWSVVKTSPSSHYLYRGSTLIDNGSGGGDLSNREIRENAVTSGDGTNYDTSQFKLLSSLYIKEPVTQSQIISMVEALDTFETNMKRKTW